MFADLARRGLAHPNAIAYVKRAVSVEVEGQEPIEVPTWGIVLVYVTFIVAAVGVSLLSYMLTDVLTALCMVETPVAAITVSPSTHEPAAKEEKETLLETGPTITLVNQKPITSSIRGTVKHLVAHAGRFAKFRGFRIYTVHSLLVALCTTFLSAALPLFPGQAIIVAALAGAATANVHAAWTHKVISMPSSKTFCQRLPAKAQWKVLALPVALASALPYISLYLSCGVAMLMGLHRLDQEDLSQYTGMQLACVVLRMLVVLVFAVTCSLFLCLPAMVTLVRIEASILPEDEDTIVPFDRTFGGKVVSKMHGGSGNVAFLDAWRSFDWEARRRLIKLIIKTFFIIAGVVFVVVHVLIAEAFVVMGPALGQAIRQAKAQGLF